MLDLSTDSLITSTTYTTSTGLVRIFGNDFSHDKVTRFLNKEALDNKKLWTFIKPFVCSVECEDSVLIVDDTIFEKPHKGVYSFDEAPLENCPYKETKKGIKWYVSVLEAKFVFANGFSISVASEWLTNQNGKFDKQDCEQAAFKRVAARVKTTFPRLAILIRADGLYCCAPVFKLVQQYQWKFIFTFKDDDLKSVWKKIKAAETATFEKILRKENGHYLHEEFTFLNRIKYQESLLNYLEHLRYYQPDQPLEKQVRLSNIFLTSSNARQINEQGRMRWKIENQGFNAQKNQGFGLEHKYARKELNTIKNYDLILQIVHMISQLVEKRSTFRKALEQSGRTIKNLIEEAIAEMKKRTIIGVEVFRSCYSTKQLRY
ncbi:MAG: hypothetical protein AAGI25_02575 [Bacteroidota bacterium]